MSQVAREMADGNLTTTVHPRSERDQLGQAMATMRSRLFGLLGHISSTSQTVASTSAQMTLSSGGRRGRVGDAGDPGGRADDARRAVGELSDAVGTVASGAEPRVRALERAREVTREVASATDTSAAAAQQAAATIGDLVGEMQSQTSRTIEIVERGERETDASAHPVEVARQAFLRIDESVQDMTTRVIDLSGAIERIALSGARLRESVEEVAAVARSSSASTEQVSASIQETSTSIGQIAANAHELAATARELQQLAGEFRL
jgi:methyl-accepting chemotaxis protein